MQKKINNLLKGKAPLKAKVIAKELGLDRKELNAFLHKHPDQYKQDDAFCWSLVKADEFELILPAGWVGAEEFERAFKLAGPVEESHLSVRIYFSTKCKTMISCNARLLALINQMARNKKKVTVDFSDAEATCAYLNRSGFFDLLDDAVEVLPARPISSTAERYKGQSETLVELSVVDPQSDNRALINDLTKKFIQQATDEYKVAAATIFGELIGNVKEHSNSILSGFAGLQKYGGSRPHIQTVVTDSGLGIPRTLRPALEKHYPSLYVRYGEQSLKTDVGLIIEVMKKGGVSRFGAGRGLGFKSSREQAMKFDAYISVRQECFCLQFEYHDGKLEEIRKKINLPKLQGTHICFDFYLD